VRVFARELGLLLAIAGAASLALGMVLGVVQDESVLQWLAYGLDIGGAILIGLGFLTGPESPRKRYLRENILKQPAPPKSESRLLIFASAGVLLLAAGTLFELAL
jgi:hypothetical protein